MDPQFDRLDADGALSFSASAPLWQREVGATSRRSGTSSQTILNDRELILT
jgi:hypothetical protein